MVTLAKAAGDTWNTVEDLRAAFEELDQKDHTDDPQYLYSASLLTAASNKSQFLAEAMLRPKWDVDNSDYWSNANITTYAPAVEAIALQWARGLALLWGVAKGLRGGSAEFARYLIDDAKEDLMAIIDGGSLGVPRRSDDPDGQIIHAGSQGASYPFFTREDETCQPYTPSSGTRDEEPY